MIEILTHSEILISLEQILQKLTNFCTFPSVYILIPFVARSAFCGMCRRVIALEYTYVLLTVHTGVKAFILHKVVDTLDCVVDMFQMHLKSVLIVSIILKAKVLQGRRQLLRSGGGGGLSL